ncbi:unnamed protein product, partial [Prorocentrum cordatum]
GMEARLQASLQTAVATASASMSQAFQDTAIDLAKQNDARFQAMEDRIAPVEARMDDLERMQQEIQMLKDELVVLNLGVSVPQTGGNWDRDPDPAAVEQTLAPLVAEAQLHDHARLESDAVSQGFWLRCKGAATLAERRVNKLPQLMRLGQGQRREVHAPAPTGAQVSLSSGKDRNRRQVTHELAPKKIRQGIERTLPHKLFMEKDAAALSPQRTQLPRVDIASPTAHPNILWNMACIRKFNLNKDEVAEAVAKALQPEAQERCLYMARCSGGAQPGGAGAAHFASWNDRAFASYSPKIIERKLRYLQTHWRGPVALATQETHAGAETTQQLLGRAARDVERFASAPIGARADAGGAAIVSPAQTGGGRIVDVPYYVIPGRALRVAASQPGAELRRWNARNFGFTAEMRARLLQQIRADPVWAHAAPAARAAVIVGDSNYGDVLERASRIDKVLVSVPRWALCQQWQAASARSEPRKLHISGASDHAMPIASITPRAPRPAAGGPAPTPTKLTKLPRYKEIVERHCEEVCWEPLAPPDAYAAHVTTLRAAAELLQAERLATDGGARRQDAKLARIVMAQNPWASDAIELGAQGQPDRA